jgi:hypothetical protein
VTLSISQASIVSALKAKKFTCEDGIVYGHCEQIAILSYAPPNRKEIMGALIARKEEETRRT